MELDRWASKHPAGQLQAVVMFDEADIYLPATRKPATKEPMIGLIKRARSAGLSLFLATQNPGDFDYTVRDNIRTWFVGKITQDRSIEKLQHMLREAGASGDRLGSQAAGEFMLLDTASGQTIKSHQSVMRTLQQSEDEILSMAAATRGEG